MHSFIKTSLQQKVLVARTYLSLCGSSQEERKHRPCWHLRLPDRLHAGLSADKLFPNARGVKVAVTHPWAWCVNDTAWQTASLPNRLKRGGVKAGGVQSWQFRCRPVLALSGPDTQTCLLFALLCCKFQSTICACFVSQRHYLTVFAT